MACHSGVTVEEGKMADAATGDRRYRVTKMKFAKTKDPVSGTKVNDKTTVIYKEFITLKNIPLAVYEWVLEHQSITTDKDSGISNDANLWAS